MVNYEWWKELNNTKPLEINCDTIRQLRNEGRGQEAKALLTAYYKDLKEIKHQFFQDRCHLAEKKRRFLKKREGLCAYCGCYEKAREGRTMCEEHLKERREYQKRMNYRGKKKQDRG